MNLMLHAILYLSSANAEKDNFKPMTRGRRLLSASDSSGGSAHLMKRHDVERIVLSLQSVEELLGVDPDLFGWL